MELGEARAAYRLGERAGAGPQGVLAVERLEQKPRRYRLVASEACLNSHQVLMVHALLGLSGKIKVDTLDPVAPAGRWRFADGIRNSYATATLDGLRDRLAGDSKLAASPPYLVDMETNRVLSGRADEIVRMLCTSFAGGGRPDLWPEAKRVRIDELTARIEDRLARPLFAGGLAAGPETQAAERRTVAMSLQFFETMLADRRFLLGDRAGLADLALYASLVRLDPVTRLLWGEPGPALEDFPELLRFVQDIHKHGRVAHTMRAGILLRHYRQSFGQASRSRMRPTALMLEALYSGRKRRA